jgi:hypothetical protein
VLPPVLAAYAPELVIAGGTAGLPSDAPVAGCVVAGSRLFLHDGLPSDYPTHLTLPSLETLLPQNVNPTLFNNILKYYQAQHPDAEAVLLRRTASA